MASENVNVRITGELRAHLDQQIGKRGLYENASEYIRDLIRRDLQGQRQAWNWLKNEFEPALRASEENYVAVSADDVIARNKKRLPAQNP